MAETNAFKNNAPTTELDGRSILLRFNIDTSATNLGAADVAVLADLPAGSIVVTHAFCSPTTAEGATGSVDLGLRPTSGAAFTADLAGLLDDKSVNSANVSTNNVGSGNPQIGSVITATDGAQLCLTANDALDTAVFDIIVELTYVDH
jgi:hypothetical protein